MIAILLGHLWCYLRGGHTYGDVMRWQFEAFQCAPIAAG